MDRDDTGQGEVSLDESLPIYIRAEPRYFGLTPHLLVAALAALSFVVGAALFASGSIAAGILLLVAGGLLGLLYIEQARHRRDTHLDRTAAEAIDRSHDLVHFAGAAVSTWTRAGRRTTTLRFELRGLRRQRDQLQHELGAAAYEADEQRVADLRGRMKKLDLRMQANEREARTALDQARRRTRRERRAVAATEVRRPHA